MVDLDQIITRKSFFFFVLTLVITSFSISYLAINFAFTLYELWLIIFVILSLLLVGIISRHKRKRDKIAYDVGQIINCLEEISDKNYEVVMKTKYFSELLQIEVLLKNLIKRLHKRDMKK